MRTKMSLTSRRELLARTCVRYRRAGWREKGRILDEFVAASGYGRKYALNLLNHPPIINMETKKPRCRRRLYQGPVQEALITVWKAANSICSKRLVPFLPEFVSAMERFGHLSLSDDTRQQLLSLSPATVDRLLHQERYANGHGLCTTKPGGLLKRQIPVRTFADWSDLAPGFIEADLVAHCGDNTEGSFLNTLVLTDVATGWTECLALLRRSEADVAAGLEIARRLLPFPLLGLDTDNGSEFINYGMLHYCEREKITFTRARAYKKNDQAHVEEKNGSVVRRLVGYDRYEGPNAWRALAALYRVLRLYVNFFQPSMKLVSKERNGSQVTKRYDRAQTPYQRVLCTDAMASGLKESLRCQYEELDPVLLLQELEQRQDKFWQHAWGKEMVPLSQSAVKPAMSSAAQDNALVIAMTRETTPCDTSSNRIQRRTRKPRVPHTWRTRIDPFGDVWGQMRILLDIDPSRTAKQLFQDLQARYPGRFADGQLRTLQRRVKTWRRENLYSEEAIQEAFTANVFSLEGQGRSGAGVCSDTRLGPPVACRTWDAISKIRYEATVLR